MQEECQNDYLDRVKTIQDSMLTFIDDEDNVEENFQNLSKLFADQKVGEKKSQLNDILYLVSNISNNHFRSETFFNKIEKILLYFKTSIKENINESDIYYIFHKNKRLLFFLINEKIITIDEHLANKILKEDVSNGSYFYHEIKNFIKIPNNENDDVVNSNDFNKKRKIGENDTRICQLIRNDLLDELIQYIKETKTPLDSRIEQSIFETNEYLLDKNPTLIEYSAFYGSIQILKYLLRNNVQISPYIWVYSIHSNNLDILHFLQDNNVYIDYNMYEPLLSESIKCHHNKIVDFLLTNYFDKEEFLTSNTIEQKFVDFSFQYYNYAFFPEELNGNSILFSLIKYAHNHLFTLIYTTKKINIRKAYNFAKNVENHEIMKLLSQASSEIFEKTPFPLLEQDADGKIRLTKVAQNRLSSSIFPVILLLFGQIRAGKSTMASNLLNGAKSEFSNSTFKISGSSKSCTHFINAVGPIKCKEIASLFDIEIDEDQNRDIFIVDSEGLYSVGGEKAKWIKQAICTLLPLVSASFYMTTTFIVNFFDEFEKYSTLIQKFKDIHINHRLCYIINQEKFEGSDVIQKLEEQNSATEKDLISYLTTKYPNVDESIYKCFSVLSFDRHPKEYYYSLQKVASYIINLCISDDTKMSGSFFAYSFEKIANNINDIYSNLGNDEMNDQIVEMFLQSLNGQMTELIKKQEKAIQNDVSSKMSLAPFYAWDNFDIDSAVEKIEETGLLDTVIKNAINEIFSDTTDFYPLIQDSSLSYIKEMTKNALRNIKIDGIKRRQMMDAMAKDVEYLKKSVTEIFDYIAKEKTQKSKNTIEIKYENDPSNGFNGILTRLGGGNAMNTSKDGIIDISCSSILNMCDCQPKNVLNYENDNLIFISEELNSSWLCIDFKDKIVNISHYTIKSQDFQEHEHLQNWEIEGSNDFNSWKTLDSQHDVKPTSDHEVLNTFEVGTNAQDFYRYIRIFQSEKKSLVLTSIEFFGVIKY